MRRRIVLAYIVIILIAISIVMLIPLYLLSKTIELKTDYALRGTDISNQDNRMLQERVGALESKIRLLSKPERFSVHEIVSDLARTKDTGISLLGFNILETDEGTISLSLAGNATNRNALLAFKKNLEEKKYILSVDLPVSNFTQNTDISFSLTLDIEPSYEK